MRKIKIDNKIHTFDISDGEGNLPFGCNGIGGMKAYLDNVRISNNCFVENCKMLDGKVNFKEKNEIRDFSHYKFFVIDDVRYEKLKEIHSRDLEKYMKIPIEERVKNILFGLKYFEIDYISDGYRFGRELTYRDFCVCFNRNRIIVFSSRHNGFIVPTYLELQKNDNNFNIIYRAIKKSIKEYLDI